jgi:hypothetical protein
LRRAPVRAALNQTVVFDEGCAMRSVTWIVAGVLLSAVGGGTVCAQSQAADATPPAASQPATPSPAPAAAQPGAQPEPAAPSFAPPTPAPAPASQPPASAPQPPAAAAPPAAYLPTAPATPLDAYRAQALDIRFSPFGMKSFALHQNGQEVTGSYADVFASSTDALAHYESSRKLAVSGTVLVVIGTVAVIAGAILLPIAYSNDDSPALAWGLMGGGLALDLAGGIMVGVGAERFNDAIEAHNDALYERVRATGPR